ncbi:MAG: LysM peptidoglycan-binding domain-containing protein [Synergistaceae bacterium]|nr:LysM peptidoglycan-binding domain-containing protein [Synergistaceae bacterium]
MLAKENNLDNPNRLKIGQELSLPLGDEVLVHSD